MDIVSEAKIPSMQTSLYQTVNMAHVPLLRAFRAALDRGNGMD